MLFYGIVMEMKINNIETGTSCGGVDGVTELLNTNLLLWDGFSTIQNRRDYSLLLLDGDGKYIDNKPNLHTWIQVFFDASYATDVITSIEGSYSLYEDKEKLAVFDYSEMAESKLTLKDGSVISWTNSNDITYKQKKSFKKVFKGHTDKVLGVNQLSENTIISWSMDGFIRFWDLLENGEGENGFFFKINKSWERAVLEATGGYELHRSRNGRFAVYDDHGEVIIEQNLCFENEPFNSKHKLDLGEGKYALWSSDSDAISITDTDKNITKIFRGHLGQIRGLIELSNNRMLSYSSDLTLRLWNVDGNTSENIDKRGGHGGLGGVTIKRIADDIYASLANESDLEKMFGATNNDFTIKLWRRNGEPVSILNGHTDFIIDLILLKGDRFLSYSKDATLKLWSHDGKLLKTMEGHKVKIDSVQVTESNLIVSISCDGIIIIWEDSGEKIRTLQTGEEKDECDDFSKKTFILLKGQKLLSWGYTNNSLYLWDINTGVIISELKEHAEPVCDPIVLSGGNFITYPKNDFNKIAPENNILYLWDNNGDLVFRFTGHSARIAGVTELEGHTLASWSDDYTVRIWNMATGNLDQLITNPLLDQLRGISGFYQLSQNRIIVTDKTMFNYDKNKHDAFILDASGEFINSLYSTDTENPCFYQNIFVLNGDGFLLRLHGEVIRFDADGNIQDKCLWDDVKYYHPEWLSTIAPDKTLKGESIYLSSNGNIISVASLNRRPFECIYWHGDSDISTYYMEDDGTTIIGLESRHVFSIKMYLGNKRISLSDLDEVVSC